MKSVSITLLTLILFTVALQGQELNMLYMAQAGYQPSDILQQARSFEEKTGIVVNLSFFEYEDQYNVIIESSKKKTADYDIILVDLIWTADFAERAIIDPIPSYLVDEVREGIIPEIYSAFTYDNRIWAVPFLANFQLFYTNMELLHRAGFIRPPATLEELVDMASTAKKMGVIEYPLFDSLRKQEALVCEFVWLVGAFGGDLLDQRGNINLTAPACRRALEFLVNLLDAGLLNPYSLHSEEVFAAEVFIWGDSLFTTNWTFLTGLIRESELPIRRSGKASLIPSVRAVASKGDTSSTISGFQGLSVTRNSLHKEKAWRFIAFLSSPEFQRKHLAEMSVWQQVWTEEITLKEDPDIELKKQQILRVHHRPIHPRYREVSARLQYWIYEALSGNVDSQEALENAQRDIDNLLQ
ncbi:MAG: extracellular solute-binding protein [Spirochaetaceae bacterium]|nr:MAG: extracellular solute-binding protein [Spirochaetaceae bacterium]